FPVRVPVPDDPVNIADVPGIHSDDVIKPVVLFRPKLPRTVVPAGNPELSELAPGAVMRRIADLLPAGGGGINVKRVGQAILIDHVLENILGHSAAADIAVANK